MLGKKHIAQMGPAGMSQYLTTVQGMPKTVEKEITTMIRDLMWGTDNRSPIALHHLYAPLEEGGIGLVDIESRNEAIEIMWLKRYLTLDHSRPAWAFATDALIGRSVVARAGAIHSKQQVNIFLQSWDTNTSYNSTLPTYIKRMLTIGKKYNVSCGAIKLDDRLKEKLPIWYHLSANPRLRRLDNTPQGTCLWDNHDVVTVLDLLKYINKPLRPRSGPSAQHKNHGRCACWACKEDRQNGCINPRKCRRSVTEMLDRLTPQWNPRPSALADDLSLTHRRKEKNILAKKTEEQSRSIRR